MNNFKKKAVAVAVGSALGLSLMSAPAQAMPAYNGCAAATSCTLAELFGGASIIMNGVVFAGFGDVAMSGYTQPFSQVTVTGDDTDGLNLGLQYSGFSIVGASYYDVSSLDYSFTVDSSGTNLLLKDASLFMRGGSNLGPSGPVSEIEEFLFDINDDYITDLYVFNDFDAQDFEDYVVYMPTDYLGVDTFLAAEDESGFSQEAWIDGFQQYFSLEMVDQEPPPPNEAPEPGTLALLGAGLAGIGFSRRRKKQS